MKTNKKSKHYINLSKYYLNFGQQGYNLYVQEA